MAGVSDGATPRDMVVAVTGNMGTAGERVVARLAAEPTVGRVIGLDSAAPAVVSERLEHHEVDLLTADLKPILEGAHAVVHAAWFPESPRLRRGRGGASLNVEVTRRVLDAASAAGVKTLVHVSSAAAYGAWADNAVPLTEDAPIRPNPGFALATEQAEAERLVAEWHESHPGTTAAVLRPAVVLGAGERESWESRTVGGGLPLRPRDAAPCQFLDPDDLAAAVALAVTRRLDGVFNVAPDGWIPGEQVRALAGGMFSLALPERWVRRLRRWSWRTKTGGVPPEAVSFTLHPWVVANDRLRAEGWEPKHSNEEVLVAGRRGSWWRELSPKRRQEVALGGAGAVLAAVFAAVGVAVRRAYSTRVDS